MVPKTRGQIRRNNKPVIERLLDSWDLWKSGENEWRSRCPFHAGSNNTTFRIHISGHWRCFKCDAWGDLEKLVMRLTGVNYQQAKAFLGNMPRMAFSLADLKTLPKYEDRKKDIENEGMVLREADIVLYTKYCPTYLVGRGFDERILQAYEIGYDHSRGRIVIPVRDIQHRLVGLTLRLDFDNQDGPKYWHDHFDKSRHLYGFHRFADRNIDQLHLVEGQLDAVRLVQLGIPAVAILGSSISQHQVELLRNHCRADKVVLTYDNDEAGQKATRQSRRLLSRVFGPNLYVAEYEGKDPGELRKADQLKLHPWMNRLFS